MSRPVALHPARGAVLRPAAAASAAVRGRPGIRPAPAPHYSIKGASATWPLRRPALPSRVGSQHSTRPGRAGRVLVQAAKRNKGLDARSFNQEEAREAAIEKLKQPSTWLLLGLGGVITVSTVGAISMMVLGPGIIIASTFAASGMAFAAFGLLFALPLVSTILFGAFGASALIVGSIGALIFQVATVLLGLSLGVWAVGKFLGGSEEVQEEVPETPEERAARELREEREREVKQLKEEQSLRAQELKDFDRRLAASAGGGGVGPVTADAMRRWTVGEVGMWLEDAGLGHYKSTFATNDIDGQVLLSLEESDLELELGVASLGERRRIMEVLKDVRLEA